MHTAEVLIHSIRKQERELAAGFMPNIKVQLEKGKINGIQRINKTSENGPAWGLAGEVWLK